MTKFLRPVFFRYSTRVTRMPALPERIHLVPLPPYSPELNPTEAIGDVVKDRIGNVLWHTIADLEQSIGEELRPLCENPE